MGYQSKNIEHVGEHVEEQCSGLIRSWEFYMVIGHKYFSCNAYTRILIPEIGIGSRVICRMLWLTPNVACNEWQVWVWLSMPWIMLRNMSEVKGLPLLRREKISPATWLVKPSSVWPHPKKGDKCYHLFNLFGITSRSRKWFSVLASRGPHTSSRCA